ncbi:hypothetical protein DID74_00380 [Candidatus Marinamargulisbacteria bacterium SCGC AG-333-B06]|nr:hypothetical protein DID74_00380 [Candidatus Marinamargulisbacteria bacterium SCGC AG-333-B06]
MQSHATTPVPIYLSGDRFRIFFSSRNKLNQNQLGYVDIDLNNPQEIIGMSSTPSLSLGPLGFFDCDGMYGTSIIKVNDKLILYYAGWNAGKDGLFYSSIGMAESTDLGKSFKRVSNAPILSRDEIDPWAVMAPFVIKDNDKWNMYYTSGIKLYKENDTLKSFYDVKLAISDDGYKWKKTGTVCIPLKNDMTNIARANVIKQQNKFLVWFPYVSNSTNQYRIGYGESSDGIHFGKFKYDNDLKVTENSTWDNEAVTYPYVFYHNNKQYMLYNGNQFGKTGFGLAVYE